MTDKEYIEREAAIRKIKEHAIKAYDIDLDNAIEFAGNRKAEISCEALYEATEVIDDVLAADVVEVVRCKECKYLMKEIEIEQTPHDFENENICFGCERIFALTGEWVDVMLDDFCSYGERKEK